MGRYTLTVETYDRQHISLQVGEDGRKATKVSLKAIDSLTTKFSNEADFICKMASIERAIGIRITYLYNKEVKTVPIAFKDKKDLVEVSFNPQNANSINVNNAVFKRNMYKFLEKLENNDFFRFAINSDLLTDKQKEYIALRILDGVYTTFCEDKIKEHSSSYRQFRNILFLVEEYDNLRQEKVPEIPECEEEDTEKFEEFFDDEERKKYMDYMDSLPDGIPDYIQAEEEKQKLKEYR